MPTTNPRTGMLWERDCRCIGVGAILSQYDEDGIEHVIAYSSKSLSPREQNYYSTTEKEALQYSLARNIFEFI